MSIDETRLREILHEELKPVRTQLTAMDHSIRGNGKPGLNQRVALLEASNKITSRLWWMMPGVVVAVATAYLTKRIG